MIINSILILSKFLSIIIISFQNFGIIYSMPSCRYLYKIHFLCNFHSFIGDYFKFRAVRGPSCCSMRFDTPNQPNPYWSNWHYSPVVATHLVMTCQVDHSMPFDNHLFQPQLTISQRLRSTSMLHLVLVSRYQAWNLMPFNIHSRYHCQRMTSMPLSAPVSQYQA